MRRPSFGVFVKRSADKFPALALRMKHSLSCKGLKWHQIKTPQHLVTKLDYLMEVSSPYVDPAVEQWRWQLFQIDCKEHAIAFENAEVDF